MTAAQINAKRQEKLAVTLKALNEKQISLSVYNAGDQLIKAYSHIEAGERQYDFFEIEALLPGNQKISINFEDDRIILAKTATTTLNLSGQALSIQIG